MKVKLEPNAEERADDSADAFNADGALDLTLPKSSSNAATAAAEKASSASQDEVINGLSAASTSASVSGAATLATKVPMNLDDLEALIDDTVRRGVLSYEADPHIAHAAAAAAAAPATPSKTNSHPAAAQAHASTPTAPHKHSTPPEEPKFPVKPIPKGARHRSASTNEYE